MENPWPDLKLLVNLYLPTQCEESGTTSLNAGGFLDPCIYMGTEHLQ